MHIAGTGRRQIGEVHRADVSRRLPAQPLPRQLQAVPVMVDAVPCALLAPIVELGALPADKTPVFEVQEPRPLAADRAEPKSAAPAEPRPNTGQLQGIVKAVEKRLHIE